MQFYLVYRGSLPATSNSSKKPEHVRAIRDKFHPQLELLWKTHPALKRLRSTAIVATEPGRFFGVLESPFEVERDPNYGAQHGFVNLCDPVIKGEKTYHPLVRKSLDLTCHLDVLFLRQEDPGALVLQSGDLDGRIKTLFDALRVPDPDVELRYPQDQNPTYCLLENDTLISGFEVSSGRLLVPETTHPSEVHLIIEVTIRVLKLGPWNACLMGD